MVESPRGFNESLNQERSVADYGFPELQTQKANLYNELSESYGVDFMADDESVIIGIIGKLPGQDKQDVIACLADIRLIITEQIEKLKRDEFADSKQQGHLEALNAGLSRVNRILIPLGFFK